MEGVSTKISGDPWDQAWANIRHGRSTCDQRMKEDSVHKNAFKYRERRPGSALDPMEGLRWLPRLQPSN
jgi:hypothetical protein